jgi:peptidyl-prolyl cis-trans isomerase SurA
MDLRRTNPLLILCLTAALACVPFGGSLAQSGEAGAGRGAGFQTLDQVVAVVNGEVITALDLKRRERLLTQELKANKRPVPEAAALDALVLDRAIFETLVLQYAAKQGLTPSATAVQEAIANNAAQNEMEVAQFLAKVLETGVTLDEYKQDVFNDMALASARERALSSKLKVTDPEIDRYLRDPQSSAQRSEYAPQVLFVPKPDNASPSELSLLNELAQQLRRQAQAVSSASAFSALQNQVNNTPSNHRIDKPFATLDNLPELYSKALEPMGVGDISPVLESSGGYFIIRLDNKRSAAGNVQQTKVRHILRRVQDNTEASDQAAQDAIKTLHNRLTLNIALFPTLARQMSQDGSARVGGDLPLALPGDMVPEFEKVMDSLAVGELSQPLRTPFGWHILQVTERKTAPLPAERLRALARNELRSRKQSEAQAEWLEQLKAQAFIEYKQIRR